MKDRGMSLIALCTLVCLILLSACGNSETEPMLENEPQNDNNFSTESASSTDSVDANETKVEDSDIATEVSLKERYLKKLQDTKKATNALVPIDSTTIALKKVENDRWELWDDLLNDIYGALQEELPAEEMEQLREEQRNWLKDRDERALEASLKFKGGTAEHLEYVAELANQTEKRCYELVEGYM